MLTLGLPEVENIRFLLVLFEGVVRSAFLEFSVLKLKVSIIIEFFRKIRTTLLRNLTLICNRY